MLADLAGIAIAVIKNVRIQDILDVAIITVMIFALLTWFKTRASRFVLIGVLLLGCVYMAARFFQLYLTIIVLQGFFAILIFVLVVIFQEDLRGFFERLAMLGSLRKKTRPLTALEKSAEIIAQTAGNLVKKRVGAIICLQGNDRLDRHLNGGTFLDGLISESLLESIFDPHSIGHDGAVIVKDDRVIMFGCHLPLSTNVEKYGTIGLRHTAALGLSERSDALCVVVSEERGTISIAQGEELKTISSPLALHEYLKKFYIGSTPSVNERPALNWLTENTKEKIVAVTLACILWVAFGYQRDIVYRDYNVPIEYKNVPPNWRIDEPKVADAKVKFQGAQQAFRLLDEKELTLSLDLSGLAEKKRDYVLTEEMVSVPPGLQVTEIHPAKIRVLASQQTAATVSVSVVTRNSLPDNLYLQKISVSPPTLKIMADARLDPAKVKLNTEPIDLSKINSSRTVEVKALPPAGTTLVNGQSSTVRVLIRVRKR